jgi:drug/metabolite transporter (DMT)-like permease
MTIAQILKLLAAAAIWGASHTLVRITVPEIGPTLTAFLRIFIAALTLGAYLLWLRGRISLKENFKDYLIVGLLNAALPIYLFSFASMRLPASYLVILNATAPISNALFSSLFLRDPFSIRKVAGILLGISGVFLLSHYGSIDARGEGVWLAMAAGLIAAICYSLCAVYIKKFVKGGNPVALTVGSSWVSCALIVPFAAAAFANQSFTWQTNSLSQVVGALMILGVMGSGVAFVFYYQLVSEIGAFRTSLVTFLMPVFGLIWGWLLLDEQVTLGMLFGVSVILGATSLFMKAPTRKLRA